MYIHECTCTHRHIYAKCTCICMCVYKFLCSEQWSSLMKGLKIIPLSYKHWSLHCTHMCTHTYVCVDVYVAHTFIMERSPYLKDLGIMFNPTATISFPLHLPKLLLWYRRCEGNVLILLYYREKQTLCLHFILAEHNSCGGLTWCPSMIHLQLKPQLQKNDEIWFLWLYFMVTLHIYETCGRKVLLLISLILGPMLSSFLSAIIRILLRIFL